MIKKPTLVLVLVVCGWVLAVAGVASGDPRHGNAAQPVPHASTDGVRIEGRSDLRVGGYASPASSASSW